MPPQTPKSAEQRTKILTAAQQLVYTKGYEQMTIQDILDELKISKGAFYHYFSSKQALLEAMIDRLQMESEKILLPILHDPQLSALEKLQRFLDATQRWKTAQKAFLLSLLHVWYTDANAIVRQKTQAALLHRFAPLFTEIIRQGIREGSFSTPYPDQAGKMFLSLLLGLGDAFANLQLEFNPRQGNPAYLEQTANAYNDALERLLGAPSGSLKLIDPSVLKEWLIAAENPK